VSCFNIFIFVAKKTKNSQLPFTIVITLIFSIVGNLDLRQGTLLVASKISSVAKTLPFGRWWTETFITETV
jgi:hypothetical protein